MLEVLGSAGAPPKLRCNTFCAKYQGLICSAVSDTGKVWTAEPTLAYRVTGRLDIHRRILHGEFNTVVTQLIRHVIVREF